MIVIRSKTHIQPGMNTVTASPLSGEKTVFQALNPTKAFGFQKQNVFVIGLGHTHMIRHQHPPPGSTRL
jgi:hypothetical protein